MEPEDAAQAKLATFDLLDLINSSASSGAKGQMASAYLNRDYLFYDVMRMQYQIDLDNIRTFEPLGAVEMLMAYPDVMAPLLDARTMIKLWWKHKMTYPEFLKSLPDKRRQEILRHIYEIALHKTDAHRRGEDAKLSEVLAKMDPIYHEAFDHLLPPGEKLEKRVLVWLMS